MSKIIAALIAVTVLAAAASPSYAFDSRKFWTTQGEQR